MSHYADATRVMQLSRTYHLLHESILVEYCQFEISGYFAAVWVVICGLDEWVVEKIFVVNTVAFISLQTLR